MPTSFCRLSSRRASPARQVQTPNRATLGQPPARASLRRNCADHRRISLPWKGPDLLSNLALRSKSTAPATLGSCALRYTLTSGRGAPTIPATRGAAVMTTSFDCLSLKGRTQRALPAQPDHEPSSSVGWVSGVLVSNSALRNRAPRELQISFRIIHLGKISAVLPFEPLRPSVQPDLRQRSTDDPCHPEEPPPCPLAEAEAFEHTAATAAARGDA